MLGLLAAPQAEQLDLEGAWRRSRSERWRSFCVAEMAGGGRRLFRWVRGVAAAPPLPEAADHAPVGTLACMDALHAGWQAMWCEEWR